MLYICARVRARDRKEIKAGHQRRPALGTFSRLKRVSAIATPAAALTVNPSTGGIYFIFTSSSTSFIHDYSRSYLPSTCVIRFVVLLHSFQSHFPIPPFFFFSLFLNLCSHYPGRRLSISYYPCWPRRWSILPLV